METNKMLKLPFNVAFGTLQRIGSIECSPAVGEPVTGARRERRMPFKVLHRLNVFVEQPPGNNLHCSKGFPPRKTQGVCCLIKEMFNVL